MTDRNWREIMWGYERWLGPQRPATAPELLREAADVLPADARPDRYGEGELVKAFERLGR